MHLRLLLCLTIAWVAIGGTVLADDAALIPEGWESTREWQRDGGTRRFEKSDLYGHIDGGAELFHEFGFEYLLVQRYLSGEQELALEVYVMSSPESALGIYLMKVNRERPIEDIEARHTAHPSQFTLLRSNYFIQINNFFADSALLPDMVALAQRTLRAIPGDAPESSLMEPDDSVIVPGSFRLIRGQFSLQSVYTLGRGDVLGLDGQRFGTVCDKVATDGDTVTVISAEYPSEDAAESAFESVRGNLDATLEVLEDSSDRLVFKDYLKEFGVIRREGAYLRIEVGHKAKPTME